MTPDAPHPDLDEAERPEVWWSPSHGVIWHEDGTHVCVERDQLVEVGFTLPEDAVPLAPSAALADAQAEIARLRAAVAEVEESARDAVTEEEQAAKGRGNYTGDEYRELMGAAELARSVLRALAAAPAPAEDGARWQRSLGVSAVVRLTRDVLGHSAGTVGLVVGQANNGPDRYQVMVPGDPGAYSVPAADLTVVQGIDLAAWWRRNPAAPAPAREQADPADERGDR